jgi:hypothetical protein
MDVGGWLPNLGLEQYEAAFRENAIDEKLLPRLTAEDLKDLGVNLVGHRRLLRGRFDREGRASAGKAGRRSLERSALVEAAEQLTRALTHIAGLPATPALRREEIKLQVAVIPPPLAGQGLCRAGNQGRSGASAYADRTR